MSKIYKQKFGVQSISGLNLNLICKVCGQRAGLHYGSDCPTIDIRTGKPFPSKSDILYEGRDYDSSVKDANEPNHDLEYHDKKCEEENKRVNRERRKR